MTLNYCRNCLALLTPGSVVIFKLKAGVTATQLAEMRVAGEAMLGKIPGKSINNPRANAA
jgi:hypothetical protein